MDVVDGQHRFVDVDAALGRLVPGCAQELARISGIGRHRHRVRVLEQRACRRLTVRHVERHAQLVTVCDIGRG